MKLKNLFAGMAFAGLLAAIPALANSVPAGQLQLVSENVATASAVAAPAWHGHHGHHSHHGWHGHHSHHGWHSHHSHHG